MSTDEAEATATATAGEGGGAAAVAAAFLPAPPVTDRAFGVLGVVAVGVAPPPAAGAATMGIFLGRPRGLGRLGSRGARGGPALPAPAAAALPVLAAFSAAKAFSAALAARTADAGTKSVTQRRHPRDEYLHLEQPPAVVVVGSVALAFFITAVFATFVEDEGEDMFFGFIVLLPTHHDRAWRNARRVRMQETSAWSVCERERARRAFSREFFCNEDMKTGGGVQ